jgi:hypothetical protein
MDEKEKLQWKTTLAHYQAWNDAEFKTRVQNAGKKSLAEKWQEFLAIMEFGLMIKPIPSEHEQRQKVEMLNRYIEAIQLFEERRKQRG